MKLQSNIITFIIFCTLYGLTACQKIDLDDLVTAEEEKKQETTTDNGGDDTEVKKENKSQLQLQCLADGTLLLPTDNHVVALSARNDDGDSVVLYVSLYEWNDVPSSLSSTNAELARQTAAMYREGNISGWRIPTKEEAQALRRQYNRNSSLPGAEVVDNLKSLNDDISKAGGIPLTALLKNDGQTAYRYLCDDGMSTFSLKTGSKTTTAGAKTKYNLRLVKDSVIVSRCSKYSL